MYVPMPGAYVPVAAANVRSSRPPPSAHGNAHDDVIRAQKKSSRPTFLEFDEAGLTGKVVRLPDRTEMSYPVNEQLIIEYYSR